MNKSIPSSNDYEHYTKTMELLMLSELKAWLLTIDHQLIILMKLLLLQLVYIKKEVVMVVTIYTLDDLWSVCL